MKQYQSVKFQKNISDSQLNKLRSATRNATKLKSPAKNAKEVTLTTMKLIFQINHY